MGKETTGVRNQGGEERAFENGGESTIEGFEKGVRRVGPRYKGVEVGIALTK